MSLFSNDLKTTLFGWGAAAAILSQLNAHKLGSGDFSQIALCAMAVCIGLLGHFSNKPDNPTEPPSIAPKAKPEKATKPKA